MIAGQVFTIDVATRLIPLDQNTAWGGDPVEQYGVVAHLGSIFVCVEMSAI